MSSGGSMNEPGKAMQDRINYQSSCGGKFPRVEHARYILWCECWHCNAETFCPWLSRNSVLAVHLSILVVGLCHLVDQEIPWIRFSWYCCAHKWAHHPSVHESIQENPSWCSVFPKWSAIRIWVRSIALPTFRSSSMLIACTTCFIETLPKSTNHSVARQGTIILAPILDVHTHNRAGEHHILVERANKPIVRECSHISKLHLLCTDCKALPLKGSRSKHRLSVQTGERNDNA